MDSMVTARMPQEKKEVGNRVLADLGMSPSRLINEIYDYVIEHKTLPLPQATKQVLSPESIEQALSFIDGIPLSSSDTLSSMSDDRIKQERLISRGLVDKGFFE